MTTMKKRILALILTLALVVSMMIPGFAAGVSMQSLNAGRTYALTPYLATSSTNLYMNIYGATGSALKGRVITLYDIATPEIDQKFYCDTKKLGNLEGKFLMALENNSYAVTRRSRDDRAFMWTYTNEPDFKDAAMSVNLSDPSDTFHLKYYSTYYGLTYASVSNGAAVYLNPGTSSWLVIGY